MAPLTRIINIFGQSPIRPLQLHMAKVLQCADALIPFMEAVIKANWSAAEKLQQHIVQLENDADALKKDIRVHLPKSLFLPVPRSDLIEILSLQDGIANKAKDIAGLSLGRQLVFPKEIQGLYMQFLQRCIAAAEKAKTAINELDELLEVGFRGKEVQLVERMINELDKVEQETDVLQVQIRQILLPLEKKLWPVDVMFIYKVIDNTGDIADNAHRVGGQLQLILAS